MKHILHATMLTVGIAVAISPGISIGRGSNVHQVAPNAIADTPLTVVSSIQLSGQVAEVGYYDGSKLGNHFTNLALTLDKEGNNVKATLVFSQGSNGWQSVDNSIPMIIHFLDGSGTDLGVIELGKATISCRNDNTTFSAKKEGLGSAFSNIKSIRIVPQEWIQTVDAC